MDSFQRELDRMQSPAHVRFAAEVAAAAEGLDKMIGKITQSADFAAFWVAVERESARWAEWQRRQQEQLLSFPRDVLRGRQRLPKRTIARPEVTTQIGFHRALVHAHVPSGSSSS
jgi:thiamine pyrophosphate-dependent acetolactate synthase large subunit-like protein